MGGGGVKYKESVREGGGGKEGQKSLETCKIIFEQALDSRLAEVIVPIDKFDFSMNFSGAFPFFKKKTN